MRIFGIDPGSVRTGYGCIESDGSRHRMISCGAIAAPSRLPFPERLHVIHSRLAELLAELRPDGIAVESLFHAVNARSALQLGHARGVVLLAATQARVPIAEYSPMEIKRAVVGYGRAEKSQVSHMVCLLLGLAEAPHPLDVSDALAVAICHLHTLGSQPMQTVENRRGTNWRNFKVDDLPR